MSEIVFATNVIIFLCSLSMKDITVPEETKAWNLGSVFIFNDLYSPSFLTSVSHQVTALGTAFYFCSCFLLFISIASGKYIFHQKHFRCLQMHLPSFNMQGQPFMLRIATTVVFLKICFDSITSLFKNFADLHIFGKKFPHLL